MSSLVQRTTAVHFTEQRRMASLHNASLAKYPALLCHLLTRREVFAHRPHYRYLYDMSIRRLQPPRWTLDQNFEITAPSWLLQAVYNIQDLYATASYYPRRGKLLRLA